MGCGSGALHVGKRWLLQAWDCVLHSAAAVAAVPGPASAPRTCAETSMAIVESCCDTAPLPGACCVCACWCQQHRLPGRCQGGACETLCARGMRVVGVHA